MENERETILITGATDGIGLELARMYAAQGARLILVGRRAARPDLPGRHLYCRVDLAREDRAARLKACLDEAEIGPLDVVIHNAGTGFHGQLAQQSAQSIREVVAVNLAAPISLSHTLLPRLRENGGKLVFISSVASSLPGPDYAVYAATKAALDGFARSLRIELRGGVRVQVIHPGATRTGMHAKMGLTREEMDWTRFTPAAKVAAHIARVVRGNRPSATIGPGNKVLHHAGLRLAWAIDPLLRWGNRNDAISQQAGEPPRCVITGAADGIGKALAWRYGRAGYTIVGVDVDAVRGAETARALGAAGIPATFMQADLSEAAEIDSVLDRVAEGAAIDVFIHNAGINAVGPFSRVPLPRQTKLLAVNLEAPLLLTAGLLHRRLFRPGGSWIFLSSLSHFVSYPGAAVYAASKDGIASFARSLYASHEAASRVLTVFPGPTRTAHARRYSPDNSRESSRMPPPVLADEIFRAAQTGRRQLIPGGTNRLFAVAGRLFPPLMEWGMAQAILKKVGDEVIV